MNPPVLKVTYSDRSNLYQLEAPASDLFYEMDVRPERNLSQVSHLDTVELLVAI